VATSSAVGHGVELASISFELLHRFWSLMKTNVSDSEGRLDLPSVEQSLTYAQIFLNYEV